MNHHLPSPATMHAPARWLRVLLALAVMLVAVLPHATLAAGALPPGRAAGHHAALVPAAGGEPCHARPDKSRHDAGKPACCIMGCGLLAQHAPAPTLAPIASRRVLRAAPAETGSGLGPDPLERPPRRTG